jgi:DNA-directed RNA polymerase subunit K/omega
MQKFDAQTRSEIITESHPETISHTTEEIQCLSKVTRDTYGDIVDELHQTTAILTKFERTRVVGLRTRQLNAGALPFIDVPRTIISNMVIALMELQQKKLPFIIQRPLSGGKFEYWRVNDLELLD